LVHILASIIFPGMTAIISWRGDRMGRAKEDLQQHNNERHTAQKPLIYEGFWVVM
jgi:hypothetical protein